MQVEERDSVAGAPDAEKTASGGREAAVKLENASSEKGSQQSYAINKLLTTSRRTLQADRAESEREGPFRGRHFDFYAGFIAPFASALIVCSESRMDHDNGDDSAGNDRL